jgi:hypothetical protein
MMGQEESRHTKNKEISQQTTLQILQCINNDK